MSAAPATTIKPELTAGQARAHIRELDGIRGLAILVVVLYHFSGLRPVGELNAAVWNLARLGWCGVDLFFVLSGFLITGILLDTREAPEYFTSFYGRRILRILPLYYAFLLVYLHGAIPLAHALGMWPEATNEAEGWFWLHLQNWKAVMGYEPLNITHFWSLAVEEQFYLVWPAVVFFVRRQYLSWICLGMIVGGLVLRLIWQTHPNGETLLYMSTVTRMDTLAFGALAAILVRGGRFPATLARRAGAVAGGGFLASFAGLLVAGRRTSQGAPYIRTWGYSLLAAAFACLVIHCVLNHGSGNRICVWMRSRVLTRLGKYSYCIYVVHVLIAYFLLRAERVIGMEPGPGFYIPLVGLNAIAGLALSYGVAVVSWNVLEKRCLALKRYFPYVYVGQVGNLGW